MPAAAVFIHELCHCAAVFLLGGRVDCIEFRLSGAAIRYHSVLSYKKEFTVAFAGPVGSFSAFLVSLVLGLYYFAGVNLILCLFNLLPAMPLDGGRMVYCLLCMRRDPAAADSVMDRLGVCIAAVLFGVQVFLLTRGVCNLFLLFPSLTILCGASKKHFTQKVKKGKI